MAGVERLLTRAERDMAAQAQDVLDRYRELVDAMPATVTFPAMRELHKLARVHLASPERRQFVKTDPENLMRVMRAIRDLPGADRPHTVALAFMACHGSLDWESDLVLLSRNELANEIGVAPPEVTKAMSVLIRMGVAFKQYRPIPGMRGRGQVIYGINPHVAHKGAGHSRAKYPKPTFTVAGGTAA